MFLFFYRLFSPHESSDDSITSKLHRGKQLSDACKPEMEKMTRAISSTLGYPQSPSAPTSPLQMKWNPNYRELNETTPERHHQHHGIHDERAFLGLMGDVVLPEQPIDYEREISGCSIIGEGHENDPMSSSVESLGVAQTWRSVEDLTALGGNENEKMRNRSGSVDS